jgi:hypothetical protein
MKLVTYDLHDANSSRREKLNDALEEMGFHAILATVWVGAPRLNGDPMLAKMKLVSGDKAIVADVEQEMPLAEFGLWPVAKAGVLRTAAIYERLNTLLTGHSMTLPASSFLTGCSSSQGSSSSALER